MKSGKFSDRMLHIASHIFQSDQKKLLLAQKFINDIEFCCPQEKFDSQYPAWFSSCKMDPGDFIFIKSSKNGNSLSYSRAYKDRQIYWVGEVIDRITVLADYDLFELLDWMLYEGKQQIEAWTRSSFKQLSNKIDFSFSDEFVDALRWKDEALQRIGLLLGCDVTNIILAYCLFGQFSRTFTRKIGDRKSPT